jgi:hypothetical protein
MPPTPQHLASLHAPAPAKRPKTGGRKKGTPNKSTRGMKGAMLEVFAGNAHLLEWARANPTDFYRLMSRLLPRPVADSREAQPITEIRWTIVRPDGHAAERPGAPQAPPSPLGLREPGGL